MRCEGYVVHCTVHWHIACLNLLKYEFIMAVCKDSYGESCQRHKLCNNHYNRLANALTLCHTSTLPTGAWIATIATIAKRNDPPPLPDQHICHRRMVRSHVVHHANRTSAMRSCPGEGDLRQAHRRTIAQSQVDPKGGEFAMRSS